MSKIEASFCRSAIWGRYAAHHVLPWTLKGVPAGAAVLEIGSGGGAMAEGILETWPSIRLTASDTDPQMVDGLERRLRRFGERARAVRYDAGALPDELAGTFDVACSFLMLHHTLDIPAVLGGLLRATKPGGQLVGYDLTRTPLAKAIHLVDRSPFALANRNELSRDLRQGGWEDISVEPAGAGHLMRFSARHPNRPT